MNKFCAFKRKVRIESEELARKIKRLDQALRNLRGDARKMLKERLHEARMLREAFMRKYSEVIHREHAPGERVLRHLEAELERLRSLGRTLSAPLT